VYLVIVSERYPLIIGCGPYRDLYKATQSKDLIKYVIDIRDGNVQLDRMFTDRRINGKNRRKINQELLKFEHLTKFINSKPQFPTKFKDSWKCKKIYNDLTYNVEPYVINRSSSNFPFQHHLHHKFQYDISFLT